MPAELILANRRWPPALVGIIDLIAGGYGVLSYAFIAVVVAPLLTLGIYKIAASDNPVTEEPRVSRQS